MIYKAFLNRQEITGFPVKGKETSEIWGGDTLLWKKEEQIKEAFTVDSYHIVATVTNGKVFASKITIEGVNNKRLYGYALFNTQNPYTDIKVYQQQAAKGTIIDTKLFTEYGKSIYVAEIKGYYITYANRITSFDITIYDITSKATSAIKLTISASEENTAYDEPLLTDMWIKGGYIYFHALLHQYDGSVSDSYSNIIEKREQVFKINLNGGIIGKYERIYDKNVGEVPVSGIANTVINSNGKYYFVKKGDVYIREIPENPFDISSKLISGKDYVTKTDADKAYQPAGSYLSGTDEELTVSGKAADAKAVGNAVAKIEGINYTDRGTLADTDAFLINDGTGMKKSVLSKLSDFVLNKIADKVFVLRLRTTVRHRL
jgi:uncharacterized protein YlzI (FlbEa/FlbD family)